MPMVSQTIIPRQYPPPPHPVSILALTKTPGQLPYVPVATHTIPPFKYRWQMPPFEASWLSYMSYKIPFQSVLYLYF